jgi:hypothetical protein
MADETNSAIQRIKNDDDPRRCQNTGGPGGQCRLVAVENSRFCPAHGGVATIKANARNELNNYRLQHHKARVIELGQSEGVKTLRDEIAILRLLVEERMNQCQTQTDLILNSGPISDLVSRIERVVTSCHKLEGSMGQLVDKQAILHFATRIVDIIAEELSTVPDADALVGRLADRIIGEIKTTQPGRTV